MLERVDALDKECEELQRQLEEREERHVTLQTKLQQMSTEKELLLVELTQQRVYIYIHLCKSIDLQPCVKWISLNL